MALGYDAKLHILAFDHRGSFQKKMFGLDGDPNAEEPERIADSKRLIYEGMLEAVRQGAEPSATGVLVDEQFGSDIPQRAKEHGLKVAMPVEKSGLEEFDFQFGEDFGAHIEKYDPDFSKVLVRLNPDGDAELNERQLGRLRRLADWLHEQPDDSRAALPSEAGRRAGGRRERKFLFE
jgi:myo-inositol catabolism protein IolC